jgi:hypothetical protein
MFRALKRFGLVPALLLWGGYSVFGFSLAGPIGGTQQQNTPDAYQTPTLGYGLMGPNFGLDEVAPKNLGEGYRWNTRNIYYAFDAQFLDYFGTNGAAAVDAAFAILNKLNNVDSYSPGLSEWPLQASRFNYTAQSAQLLDVKTEVLTEMMEQLGLAEPDRYTFCLRDRDTTGATCPNYTYNVIERNFDPVTQTYSTYVNGVLYTFRIIESCPFTPNPYAPLVSDAETLVVDPDQEADSLSAVAAGQYNGFSSQISGLGPTEFGRYYLGLTRDDVGGFRYLLSTNTINTETVDSNSLLEAPPPQASIVITSNLAVLSQAALTNNEAALLALFPSLQITSATNLGYAFVYTTNLVTNVTPVNEGYVGQMQTNIITVVTSNALPTYGYTYGNVITNFTFTNAGVLVTNSPSEYLLVPSNQCGFTILSNALTSVVITTNTNSIVTVFTNHALIVDIFSCIPNSVALREGVEKINFLRVDYDSFVGQSWGPVTNTYTLTAITNNHPVTQTFFRVVNQPDILFTAQDLQSGPSAAAGVFVVARTGPNFNQSQILRGLAGPGTISEPVQITFDKVGPIFTVSYPSFLVPTDPNGGTNVSDFRWATFDGTTNAPVVYPVNSDYASLVNNIFLQITVPGSMPNGNINQPYSFELAASGATPPPYYYSLVPNSGSLPAGLGIVTNVVGSATNVFISGTPTVTGIFDFSLQVMDTSVPPRASARNFSVEIDP